MIFNRFKHVDQWVYEGQLLDLWQSELVLSFTAGNGLTAAADTSLVNTILAKASGQFGSATNTTGANWIALYTTQFTLAAKAGGTEWLAASDTNYARVAVGASGAGWTVVAWSTTGTIFNNTSQLAFLAVATTAQVLFSVGFCDALTAGNIDWFADLASSQAVAIGIIVQFNAATDIIFTLL